MLGHSLRRLCARRTIAKRLFGEKRGEYAVLNDQDLQSFEQIVGKQNVLTEELDTYNTDFMKWYKGLRLLLILSLHFLKTKISLINYF